MGEGEHSQVCCIFMVWLEISFMLVKWETQVYELCLRKIHVKCYEARWYDVGNYPIGTLYKLLGRTDDGSFHHVVDPKTEEILSCVIDLTMLWHR